jgi:hypothetical protein
MGAAASTQVPAQETSLPEGGVGAEEADPTSAEGQAAVGDANDEPLPRPPTGHSSGSVSGSGGGSRNSSRKGSASAGPGSRPQSALPPPKHVWQFTEAGPGAAVPTAFMEVQPEAESAEGVLDGIQSALREDAPPSVSSLEEKLRRVHAIMADLDGDERIAMLTAESRQAREMRVNVAKRLAELQDASEKKRQREELNKRKEFLYQKAKMVESILEKRSKQVQLKKDIERYEAKEVASIARLEQLDTLLSDREQSHRQACAEWEEKFEPVVGAMSHAGDAKATLHSAAAASEDTAFINRDITRELQSLLSKTLVHSSAELYAQRSALHTFRLDLERRLAALRAEHPGLGALPVRAAGVIIRLLHEPGDKLIKASADFDQRMRSNISDFKDRIQMYKDEAEWLQATPSTKAWRDLESQLSSVTNRNEMLEKVEMAHAFVASWHEQKAMRKVDEDRAAREQQVKRVCRQLLAEVADSFARGLCEHVLALTQAADQACMGAVSAALAGRRLRALPDTMGLVRGHLHASAAALLYGQGQGQGQGRAEREVGAAPTLLCSENNPMAIPSRDTTHVRSRCTSEIVLKKLLMRPRDAMAMDLLVAHEAEALDDLVVTPVGGGGRGRGKGGSVRLPGSAGELSLLRLLPRVQAAQSLLVAGTHLGRFAVWAIKWSSGGGSGDAAAPAAPPPQLVAYSPRLPSEEVSPIEDLKESPTSPNLIVVLDKRGSVRVWTLSPPARRGRHSGAAFSNNPSKFVPLVPACIFMLTPSELNLPLPPPLSHFHDKKPLDAQAGVQPTAICFHPSCNFAGRNPALLVGTAGGDVYKVNMDFKEPALAAPILYLKPFVHVEFPHALLQEAQISVPSPDDGDGGDGSAVNKVYREVFHFHKSPIVFLDVLYRASEHLLSIDAAGAVAKWTYRREHFSGSGWFTPVSTTFLDLTFLSHEPLPNTHSTSTPDLSNYTEKIDCPPPYLLDTLRLWKRRRISMPPGDTYAILETFFPLIESEECEVQYERLTMIPDPNAAQSQKSTEAGAGAEGSGSHSSPWASDSGKSNASAAEGEGEGDGGGVSDVIWMRQNTRRCLSGSTIHDVCLSEDGADVGLLLSTMCYPRSSMYATALESKLQQQARALAAQAQEEQAEAEAAIGSEDDGGSAPAPAPAVGEDVGEGDGGIEVGMALHGVLAVLDSRGLALHQSFIVFELDARQGEKVVSLRLGPLLPRVGTRTAIVQTSTRLRLFCTDTGVEVFPYSGAFPFYYPPAPAPSRKQKFPRAVCAVCPHLSMVAFGSNASPDLTVCSMHHMNEANKATQKKIEFTDAEKEKLHHRFRHVSGPTTTSARESGAKEIANFIVDILVDGVIATVSARVNQSNIIKEMYGSDENLGTVFPTVWPSPGRPEEGQGDAPLTEGLDTFEEEEEEEEEAVVPNAAVQPDSNEPEAEAGPEEEAETETEIEAGVDTEIDAEIDAGVEAEIDAGVDAGAEVEVEVEHHSDANGDIDTEADGAREAAAESEAADSDPAGATAGGVAADSAVSASALPDENQDVHMEDKVGDAPAEPVEAGNDEYGEEEGG